MLFLRKTKTWPYEDEDRIVSLAEEFQETIDSISVFEVADESELKIALALYNAARKYEKHADYVTFGRELLVQFGIRVVVSEGDSPFGFMRSRHRDLVGLENVLGFAQALAGMCSRMLKRDVTALVRQERRDLTHSTADEWATTAEWTRPR